MRSKAARKRSAGIETGGVDLTRLRVKLDYSIDAKSQKRCANI
jgi:hypothetical protein